MDECATGLWRQAVDNAVEILRGNLPEFTHSFTTPVTRNNFYQPMENTDWTTGFTTGCYWLAWELSGDAAFRAAAEIQVESFYRRIQQHVNTDHHDMGFLYTPSCVAAYKLTGSATGRKAALLAADNLLGRFQQRGQFIQAWGVLGDEKEYRLIIDCLLNLPLLYWASEETGDEKYRRVALAHTKTALANLIREDDSTYHTYFFSKETGRPLRGVTAQGHRDGSAWARGQAWGIYGLALAHRYTGLQECLPLFRRVTDFFLEHLPEDGIPYWDLDFIVGEEPRDSSAAAIALCGIQEMAPHLAPEERRRYLEAAEDMSCALYAHCATGGQNATPNANGLLQHGVYAKSTPFNTVSDYGVDECNTWGDYFWLEHLRRAKGGWNSYW